MVTLLKNRFNKFALANNKNAMIHFMMETLNNLIKITRCPIMMIEILIDMIKT